MRGEITRLTLVWVLLFAIAGGEFLFSAAHIPIGTRPLLLVFAGVMVVLIVFCFMHIGKMPVVARGFGVAAVFWLIVLFGVSMADPLTRHMWLVQSYSPQ